VDDAGVRKHYSATFKAHVVQDVLKGEKTIGQLASEHGVHPNLISLWKATALERFPSLFERDNADRVGERLVHERQLRELYEEIGRLTTQVSFLKKKSGIVGE
jgi:transposase-like protein